MTASAAGGNGTARWCDTRPGRATRRPARCRGWCARCPGAARASPGRRRASPPVPLPSSRSSAEVARGEHAAGEGHVHVQVVETHAPVTRAAERDLALRRSARRDRRRTGRWRSVRGAADRGIPAGRAFPAPFRVATLKNGTGSTVLVSRTLTCPGSESTSPRDLLAAAARPHEPQPAQIPAVAVPREIGFRAVEIEIVVREPPEREVAGELQRRGAAGGGRRWRRSPTAAASGGPRRARPSSWSCGVSRSVKSPSAAIGPTNSRCSASRSRPLWSWKCTSPVAGLKSPWAVSVPWASVSSACWRWNAPAA